LRSMGVPYTTLFRSDPKRTLMGAAQEAWVFDQLRASQRAGTPWTLLGQQVIFSPITLPGTRITNNDVWDGYPAQRTRVLDFIERSEEHTSELQSRGH